MPTNGVEVGIQGPQGQTWGPDQNPARMDICLRRACVSQISFLCFWERLLHSALNSLGDRFFHECHCRPILCAAFVLKSSPSKDEKQKKLHKACSGYSSNPALWGNFVLLAFAHILYSGLNTIIITPFSQVQFFPHLRHR